MAELIECVGCRSFINGEIDVIRDAGSGAYCRFCWTALDSAVEDKLSCG